MFKADPKRHPSCPHLMLLPRAASLPPWPPWASFRLPVGGLGPRPPRSGFLVSVFQHARPPATPRLLGPPLTERSKRDGPTIATPSRADAPRRRPVAAVRHATAAEEPATHWAGRQKARAALASATRLMSESDRASFAAYDVEFVVEISRCRAPLHRSTTQALRPAADM